MNTLEWMYPVATLAPGETWETRFRLRHLEDVVPERIGAVLAEGEGDRE